MNIFISYSRKDAAFVERLKTALEAGKIGVTIDTESLVFGDNLQEFVERSVRETDLTIAVISRNSLQSVWVIAEALETLMYEHIEEKKRFLPIFIDRSVFDDNFFLEIAEHVNARITELVEKFHKAVKLGTGTKHYDTKRERLEQLRNNLGTVFHNLRERLLLDFSKEKFDENLPKLIEEIKLSSSEKLSLKPIDFSAEISEYSRNFVGRQWINDKIDHWLKKDHRKVFMLVAEPGFGKSAISVWLLQNRDDVVGFHLCSYTNPRSTIPHDFVDNLVAQLYSLPGFAKLLKSKFPGVRRKTAAIAFRELIIDPLHNAQLPVPPKPQIIIIDALDEAVSKVERESILDLLVTQIRFFPSWLRIVAMTRPDQRILNQFEEMYLLEDSIDTPENIQDLQNQDIQNYVCTRLVPLSLQCSPDENKHSVMQKIVSLAQGNFLYAQKVIDALENGRFSVPDIGKLAPGLSNFYETAFKKQFPNRSEYAEVYRPILSTLTAARDSLSIEIIEQACDIVPEQLFQLSIFLRKSVVEEHPNYTLYHKSLKDWLTNKEKALSFYIPDDEGDQLLANFGMQEFENGVETMSAYSKEHLSVHLASMERWEDLLHLIRNTGGRSVNAIKQQAGQWEIPIIRWDELNLLERWTEKGYASEGLECLNGMIEYLKRQNRELSLAAGLSTQIARIYNRRGEFVEAEQHLKQAMEMASVNDRRIQVVAQHELGSICLYRGDRKAAANAYSKALDLCLQPEPIHSEAAANFLGLAITRISICCDDEVIRLATEALQQACKVEDTPHIIAAHRILANVYADHIKDDQAEKHLKEAIELAETKGVLIEKVELECLQGWILYNRAIFNNTPLTQAIELFENTAIEAKKISDIPNYISAKLGLVWCALVQNETNKAQKLLSQVVIPSELFHDLEVRVQLSYAVVAHQSGDFDTAEKHYQKTMMLSQKYGHQARKADALVGLGSTYWHRGLCDKAESCWAESLRIVEKCTPTRQKLIRLGIERGRENFRAIPL